MREDQGRPPACRRGQHHQRELRQPHSLVVEAWVLLFNLSAPCPFSLPHSARHVPDNVLDFGPARDWWECALESLLGYLTRAGAKQRNHVPAAIFNRHMLHRGLFVLRAAIEAEAGQVAP